MKFERVLSSLRFAFGIETGKARELFAMAEKSKVKEVCLKTTSARDGVKAFQ